MSASNTDPSNTILSHDLLPEAQLAQRWSKSTRTLVRWRAANYGPPFVIIGRTVFYLITDIETFELASRRGGGL